jgi:lipopolysaccharide export system protein LptA
MNRRRIWAGLCVAVFTGSALYSASSQEPKKPQAAAGQPEKADKKPKTLNIRYSAWSHSDSTEISDFKEAVITDVDEGTVFRADKMKVNNKKGIQAADATGNLLVTDKQADVTGENAVIHFAKSKRLVVLTGKVLITVKPKSEQKDPTTAEVGPAPVVLQDGKAKIADAKPDDDDESAGSARKYPATITCDKVEYEYAKSKKHAVLTGSFKVVQQMPNRTRTLYADHGEWFGLEDRLLLHAPVRWEDTKNNMKGQSPGDVTVFTKENDERIEMPKGGSFVVEVEEEEEEPSAPGKAGAKPPVGKPEEKPAPKPGPDKKAV